MTVKKFVRLDMELPRQPNINQRPWLITGLLLAFTILLWMAYAYYKNLNAQPVHEHYEQQNVKH